jgi:hypothetical protein
MIVRESDYQDAVRFNGKRREEGEKIMAGKNRKKSQERINLKEESHETL